MILQDINWAGFFCSAFLAIVFLQSGIDKMINYKTESGWIRQKFVKNALYSYVGFLFISLTVFELISGALSFIGAIHVLISDNPYIARWGAWFSTLTMIMLIFGLRVTKDYSGAATLVPYFIAGIIGLYALAA
ncbi:MAG: DoxX family protein [Bacteroidetes bacterium]|nr:DoxX family protein [Bacteroidota bacterium]